MTALDPPKRVAPIFPVRDLGSAVDHYRALGFAVETYDGAPYAYARWGEVEIHLAEVGGRPSLKPKRNMSAAYLWVTERGVFREMRASAKIGTFIGVTSAIGSIGWYTVFAMQNASYVRAVGQIEVVFTLLIAWFYFRERITVLELAGVALTVAGILSGRVIDEARVAVEVLRDPFRNSIVVARVDAR